jgi:hypothetical protein
VEFAVKTIEEMTAADMEAEIRENNRLAREENAKKCAEAFESETIAPTLAKLRADHAWREPDAQRSSCGTRINLYWQKKKLTHETVTIPNDVGIRKIEDHVKGGGAFAGPLSGPRSEAVKRERIIAAVEVCLFADGSVEVIKLRGGQPFEAFRREDGFGAALAWLEAIQ